MAIDGMNRGGVHLRLRRALPGRGRHGHGTPALVHFAKLNPLSETCLAVLQENRHFRKTFSS